MIWESSLPETTCGPGSRMSATDSVREWLPGALERLGVKTLLDAPCGDRNWIRHIALPCRYIGVDNEPAAIERARADGADVRRLDIRHDPLPKADAILSRDFFQHLSVHDADLALVNMIETGARHLIATCHGCSGPDIETGAFRYVNMSDWLGTAPIDLCIDGANGRILGVWAL